MRKTFRILLLALAAIFAFNIEAKATSPSVNIPSDTEIKEAVDKLDSLATAPIYTRDPEERERRYQWREDALETVTDAVISIAAILAFPLLLLVAVILTMRYKRQMLLDKYQIVEQAMRNDYRLPERFFDDRSERLTQLRALKSSLIWIACGLTCVLFAIACNGVNEFAALMSLPLFIGFAKLTVYFVGRREKQSSNCNSPEDAEQD